MTHLESEIRTIDKPQETLFSFLSDFNDWQKLMPDRVENWKSTKDNCSFTIKGTADLGMKITEREPAHSIIISSDDPAPFEFNLKVKLKKVEEGKTAIQFLFDAEMSFFIEMLVKTPLTNFLNMLGEKLQGI